MEQAMSPPFVAWATFYVLLGSAAAALIGLQLVVIVLGAQVNALSRTAMRAFGTPTIVHFCATLSISAILSAPWHSVTGVAACIAVFGILGIVYLIRVVTHANLQTDYAPVLEDWLWHLVLPLLAYGMFVATAIALRRHTADALFVAGAAAILLLFIGIHNAWDAATYIALDRPQRKPAGDQQNRDSAT
jgi:hypothetical protein